ncbi:MAG: Asp-tRNA(Asn)/Glu-tRNA(Gln) amidotransferase subunit GatC [Vicinamibacterales bacterium]
MVLAIAELAHLELTADEVATLGTELTAILGFATIVQQVDTTSVPPTTHAFGVASPLRADTPEPSPPRDAMLANAPEPAPRSGHMKVPQVMG